MTTTTAVQTPLTPAELASYYDSQIASERQRRQAEQAAEQQRQEEIRNELDAAIMAAVDSAGIDGQFLTIHEAGNFYRRNGRISMPGFASFELRAEYNGGGDKIAVFVWLNGVSYSQAKRESISNAIADTRRKWLEAEKRNQAEREARAAEEATRQAEQEARQQHDADALATWAPQYRQYIDRLLSAHAHNAAILQPIAAELGSRQFSAARLTYGITADDADPTTDTAWIAGGGQTDDGYWLEIDRQGQIEPTLIFHAVKLSAARTWTPAAVHEESGSNSSPDTPPIRQAMIRTGAGNWQIIAPPAAGDLRSEIEPRLSGLASAPERPDLPALWQPSAGDELARQLEAETIPDEEQRAALVGNFAGDFPSADPIPF